jgi:hypothetical protein
MKWTLVKLVAIVFIAGLVMILPYNPFCSHCQQHEQRVTIFFTNDVHGTLAPCG